MTLRLVRKGEVQAFLNLAEQEDEQMVLKPPAKCVKTPGLSAVLPAWWMASNVSYKHFACIFKLQLCEPRKKRQGAMTHRTKISS
jgi:hypothetical protein